MKEQGKVSVQTRRGFALFFKVKYRRKPIRIIVREYGWV